MVCAKVWWFDAPKFDGSCAEQKSEDGIQKSNGLSSFWRTGTMNWQAKAQWSKQDFEK